MSRQRLAKNFDLVKHVKRNSKGYISYKHPKMLKTLSFAKDVDRANQVAALCNARLDDRLPTVDELVAQLIKEVEEKEKARKEAQDIAIYTCNLSRNY